MLIKHAILYGPPAPPPAAEYLLLEDNSFFLLEDGVSKIELE